MTTDILERLPWNDVVAVGVRTSAEGPWQEDLFWQFLCRDRIIELPGALVCEASFATLTAHLPGIDWRKVAQATGSTEERIFRVWGPGSPERADRDALRARFAALVGRLGGDAGASGEVFEQLHAAWSAAGRHYHNLDHLAACLYELDAARVEPSCSDVVELALWYHDAIVDLRASDSEQRSAQLLARDAATLALPGDTAHRAAQLVRATAHAAGAAPHGDRAIDLIIDIDLSILGRDILCFMDFEYSVEEEVAPRWQFRFRIARGRFLASLLASPSLFRTEHFRTRYERSARAQMRGLLDSPRYRAYRWSRWLPIGR